jgi:tryptophan synthase alpha subunit
MRRFQAQFDRTKTKAKRALLVFMTLGPLVDVA